MKIVQTTEYVPPGHTNYFRAEIVRVDGTTVLIPLQGTSESRAYKEFRKMIDVDPSILDGEIDGVYVVEYHRYSKAHFVV